MFANTLGNSCTCLLTRLPSDPGGETKPFWVSTTFDGVPKPLNQKGLLWAPLTEETGLIHVLGGGGGATPHRVIRN